MKLNLYSSMWPQKGDWRSALRLAQTNEWQGIEGPLHSQPDERKMQMEMVRAAGMEWIVEVCTATRPGAYVPEPGLPPNQHLDSLETALEQALPLNPPFVTTMGGSDAWSFSDMVDFLTGVVNLSQRYNLPIAVETHRSRCFFNPWLTRDLLREVTEIQVTADVSHWCVVTERLVLNEEPEILDLLSERVIHIHGRIGYDQGPQVPHPGAPEYSAARSAHWTWWNQIFSGMAKRGQETVTITPEFGPDGYLQTAPFTQFPVGDLNEINTWMGRFLRDQICHHPLFKPSTH